MAKKFKIKKGDKVDVDRRQGQGQDRRGRARPAQGRPRSWSRASTWSSATSGRPRGTPAGSSTREAPIHISNVALIDPKTDLPTRVGYKTIEGDRKVRFAKRSGETIDT